ncbi:hypothetical protein RHA1_ro11099 (plasmid) [Rhodococcus jostii RHA1]|uniref:Uncharacterized protein n=1 Tax=Rhodococcus jostii (strain RHA1) TaxID=101510 RepID=Q0RVE0_RHOJR|nr:hypothetical protein RHA1_ro11099 [Rhodococcus jostii RHA1]
MAAAPCHGHRGCSTDRGSRRAPPLPTLPPAAEPIAAEPVWIAARWVFTGDSQARPHLPPPRNTPVRCTGAGGGYVVIAAGGVGAFIGRHDGGNRLGRAAERVPRS